MVRFVIFFWLSIHLYWMELYSNNYLSIDRHSSMIRALCRGHPTAALNLAHTI